MCKVGLVQQTEQQSKRVNSYVSAVSNNTTPVTSYEASGYV